MNSMRRFITYAASGRLQALTAATLAALSYAPLLAAGFIFPPIFLVAPLAIFASIAVVCLTVLRQGLLEGMLVAIGPAFLTLLPVMFGDPHTAAAEGAPIESVRALLWWPFAFMVVALMVPAMAAAWRLRTTNLHGDAVVGAVVALGVMTSVMVLSGTNPMAWTYEHMRAVITALRPELAQTLPVPAGMAGPAGAGSGLGIGMQAAFMLVWAMVSVLLGRWAHAVLDNPGGFGREFRALRINWRVAAVVGGLAALSLLGGTVAQWSTALLPLLLFAFAFQALAVVHALVRQREAGRAWLVAMYVLLVLPLSNVVAGPLAALTGVADCWLDFRARAGAKD